MRLGHAKINVPVPFFFSEDGLRRVGGNNTLYVKLLRQFAVEQADTVERIRTALAAHDVEAATRLAHTLKGVALEALGLPPQCAGGRR